MNRTVNQSAPFVDNRGFLTLSAAKEMNDLLREIPIYGNGSPEGVIEALQYQKYVDRTGTPGAIVYIKMQPQIGGDRKKGWEVI